jgi:2-oxoglutarate dehydrogenase E1 component
MTSEFEKNSFLFAGNLVFIEEMYQQYLKDSKSVDISWQEFFKNYADSNGKIRPSWGEAPTILNAKIAEDKKPTKPLKDTSLDVLKLRAAEMISAYRERGHYLSNLDPLNMEVPKSKAELALDLKDFGIVDTDLSLEIETKFGKTTISNLVKILDNIYAGKVGIECSHLRNTEEIKWLYDKFESRNLANFTKDEKISILDNLIAAGGMEHYLHVKFPGAKRFSIEGGDATIAALEDAVEFFAKDDTKEVVIGMAHRGRLATLTRILGKPYRALFAEFKGGAAFPSDLGISGDVKYHMGYSSIRKFGDNEVTMTLLPNPSHLEAVNPVVAGNVRAKQDILQDKERRLVSGILIHGDDAFCGQGVVAESLVMSYLKPYNVGGILHFVINNQVGFTANAWDNRPGRYSTDIAKMSGSPILHVNGDDAEAVIFATRIALHYRKIFKKDVVVEIVCYRKYGHNEGDEPMYTQPQMYNIISKKETPADIYSNRLEGEATIDSSCYEMLKAKFKAYLDTEFDASSEYKTPSHNFTGLWEGFERNGKEVVTGISKKLLTKLRLGVCNVPADFGLNPKLKKLFDQHVEDVKNDVAVDWAVGERLAFASLLLEGIPIRMTGQDAGRGTFSHRHSVLHDQNNGYKYIPLNNIEGQKAFYEVADSNLSEYGVLGFEYGYSLVNPKHLVIWEAQFGDFANGAQIMIDQFIAASEQKWMQMSGLVMLLPHGYEGQGPEHSSARLERFLQLCAENNMQVVNPTTPASIFHLLRRQVLRNFRKPLVVMTPKSLLRHKLAVSNMSELVEETSFKPVIDDKKIEHKLAKRVVVCSGKIYYDLLESQTKNNIKDIAIVRVEQLYPFPEKELKEILNKYTSIKEVIWAQEEPENMGAWTFVKTYLDNIIENKKLCYVGRDPSASPAVGYLSTHNAQQAEIVKKYMG